MRNLKRLHAGELALPFAGAAVVIGTLAWYGAQMPDPMATSWGFGGPPKARMSQTMHAAINLAGWTFCWAWVWRSRLRQLRGLWGEIGWSYTSASIILVSLLGTVGRNVGAQAWNTTRPSSLGDGLWLVFGSIALYHALGIVRRAANARLPWSAEPLIDTTEEPSAGLSPEERVVWTASIRRGNGLGLVPVVAVWALQATVTDAIGLAVVAVLLGVHLDRQWRGRVVIDRAGVKVRTGGHSLFVPLAEIVSARVVWLPPSAYEGGVRFESGPPSDPEAPEYRARLLSGSGPALHLDTVKGDVLLTIPRAREAAGVVNDLRRAQPLTVVK